MPRSRTIRYGFFTNEHLAECSYEARLLFAGLWLLADREGRLEDRPARIKAALFPFNNIDAEKLLIELTNRNFIIRYEASGLKLLVIPNFSKHQNVHPKEPESSLPGPRKATANRGKQRLDPSYPSYPSCTSITSEPSSASPSDPSITSLPNGKDNAPAADAGDFAAWWSTYPKKVGKQAAQPCWQRAVKKIQQDRKTSRSSAIEALLETTRKFSQTPKAKGEFCPNPATWLNQGRWDDDPAAWESAPAQQRATFDIDAVNLGGDP